MILITSRAGTTMEAQGKSEPSMHRHGRQALEGIRRRKTKVACNMLQECKKEQATFSADRIRNHDCQYEEAALSTASHKATAAGKHLSPGFAPRIAKQMLSG